MNLVGILLIVGLVIVMVALVIVGIGPVFGLRIAARHQEHVAFVPDLLPKEKIRETFHELGWTQCGEEADRMEARTSVNWRSWGEIVSIELRDDGAKVSSECAFASQIIDYGKNRMNVRKLIETLKKKMPDQPPQR